MADGKVIIDVILDDGSVAKGVARIDQSLGGLGGTAKRSSLNIGRIVSALGLVYAAKKGIDAVRNSLDGAIDRYDTLNNFPRVMQMIGFDAEQSEKAIQRLSDGVQGLPTRLDAVARTAQNIAVMTNDLDMAVETTLALNNAFLASGASTADAERGLQQYVQMLAKGEVDLQSWRTLQETMGVALNKTAEAFGFAGASAQQDLYQALKDGHITFDEFNAKLIELSEAQGGFADMAREASGGIKTAWTNMGTWIVAGVADIIGAIDEALGGTGEIENMINRLKPVIQGMFGTIAENIPKVVERIKEVYQSLQPWLPLITAIIAGVVSMVAAWSAFNSVKDIIKGVRSSFQALNIAMSANPWLLVIGAIITAAVLIYHHWDEIKEFIINTWEGIINFLSNTWDSIKETFHNALKWIDDITGGAFSGYLEIVTSYMDMVWGIIKDVWDFIKNTFNNVLDFLKALVKGDFEGMKETIRNQMENARTLLSNIWERIRTFFGDILSRIWDAVKSRFENMKEAVRSRTENARETISNIWNRIKTFFSDILGNIWSTVRQKFTDMVNSVREKMSDARKRVEEGWNRAKEFLANIDLFQIGRDIIQGLINGIGSMASALMEKAKSIANSVKDTITNAFSIASPSKWMRDMIGRNMILGWIDGIDRERRAMMRKAEEMSGWMKPDISNPLRGISLPLGNIMPIGTIGGSNTTQTSNVDNSKTIHVNTYADSDQKVATQVEKTIRRVVFQMG